MTETKPPVHFSVVLDRSGSMASIADDIVGGFNEYLSRQQKEPGEARVTLIQFDGQDPFEVLVDALVAQVVVGLPRDMLLRLLGRPAHRAGEWQNRETW